MQVFTHEVPFPQVSRYLLLGRVVDGERPSRPPNREILGLSDDIWLLMRNCWDGDPTARPHVAKVLSSFEAASCCWISPTSEAIANLGLDRSIAARRPPTGGSTIMGLVDRSPCPTEHLVLPRTSPFCGMTLPRQLTRLLKAIRLPRWRGGVAMGVNIGELYLFFHFSSKSQGLRLHRSLCKPACI